jgi:zinc transport system substrate-binding protein
MKRRLPFVLGLPFILWICWAFVGCGTATDPWAGETGQPRVVVTIAPLYSLVRGVAGDRVAIKCFCTTTGPHHYQLDARDARVLSKADLFLAVGLRLDDAFADGARTLARRADLRFIKLGQRLDTKNLLELKHDHSHAEGGHAHHHGKWDPHIWLGIPEVITMVNNIRDELCEIDSAHADEYKKNAEGYIATLTKLHEDGKKLLADKKVKRIISFHEALGYFARSFDLEIADVIETGPGDEPSTAHLAAIEKRCKDPMKPVGVIAVEPQYPKSSSAKTLKDSLNRQGVTIELTEIDPLETAEADELKKEGRDWYVTRMHKNLENLKQALK